MSNLFEDLSYEIILERMLNRVSSSIDKREGSIIYDALAPAAMELMLMYVELERVLNEGFGDTASREYLIMRAAERGISPSDATYAILKGEFNQDVDIGARFSCGSLTYEVTEQIADCEYKLQCETVGSAGNSTFGTLIPIDYIDGLTTATLTELLIPGEDEEDTEVFRERYFASFDSQAFGGNKTDYLEKTNEIAGVGGVKVYPVWNGGGTVKLVIIDSEFNSPSDELIDTVQTAVDPVVNGGEGVGFAPIGHVVTVSAVDQLGIDVSATFTYVDGYDFETSKASIQTAIGEYFTELAETWADEDYLVVRLSQIETRILALAMIVDVENTTINEVSKNITLGTDEIPVLGDLSELDLSEVASDE